METFFQQQLTLEELTEFMIGRVIEQHQVALTLAPNCERFCVGDWILFDELLRAYRSLERQSLFERKAPGSKVATQLIAANIDSVMIVCSLNNDFNLGRIERYLARHSTALYVQPTI